MTEPAHPPIVAKAPPRASHKPHHAKAQDDENIPDRPAEEIFFARHQAMGQPQTESSDQ